MANGFIRIPRTFYETDLWNPDREFTPLEAFLDLIRRINFDTRPVTRRIGGRHITYGRDEVSLSVSFLVKAWNWTTKRVRGFLKRLEDARLIRIIRQEHGGANIIRLLFTDTPSVCDGLAAGTAEGMPQGKGIAPAEAVSLSGETPEHPAQKGRPKDRKADRSTDRNIKRRRETEKEISSHSTEEKEKEKENGKEYGYVAAPYDQSGTHDESGKEYGHVAAPYDESGTHDESGKEYGYVAAPQDESGKEYGYVAAPYDQSGKEYGYVAAPQDESGKEYGYVAAPYDQSGKEYGHVAARHDQSGKECPADIAPVRTSPTAVCAEPAAAEVEAYCRAEGLTQVNAATFCLYYAARGWRSGGQPIRDWRAVVRRWNAREAQPTAVATRPALRTLHSLPRESPAVGLALEAYRSHCRRCGG